MLTFYLGILGLGLLAVAIILINEKKSSGSSAVDLLNNIHVDEDLSDSKEKASNEESSSDFLKRLRLNDEKNKKVDQLASVAPDPSANATSNATEKPVQELLKKLNDGKSSQTNNDTLNLQP